MGRAHQIETRFVVQFLEGTAFEVGFDIENPRHATTAFYPDCVMLQGGGLNNFIHNSGAQRRGSILNIASEMVPEAGLEPARVLPHRILNPTCLPISPLRQRRQVPR